MDLPFYLPTSIGELAAIAHVPDGDVQGPPVLILPGRNPRSKGRVWWELARDLADRGRPCFRLDFPGVGLSPAVADSGAQGDPALPNEASPPLLEAAAWVRKACGSPRVAVAGMCAGAVATISLAARDPAIDTVVAVNTPFFIKDRSPIDKHVERARAAVAAVDPLGRRRTVRVEKRRAGERLRWVAGLREDLLRIPASTRIVLFYGSDDAYYEDLISGRDDGRVPPEIFDRCTLIVRDQARLYLSTAPPDMAWLRQRVVSFLIETSRLTDPSTAP